MDPMLIGYNLPFAPEGKDPTDYEFTMSALGNTTQNGQQVRGWKVYDLSKGLNVKTVNVPPLGIWRDGFWLTDAEEETGKPYDKRAWWADEIIEEGGIPTNVGKMTQTERYSTWVCSGEGQPGAWKYVAYTVPTSQAGAQVPKHPIMWPKELKEYTGHCPSITGSGFTSYQARPVVAPAAPPAPQAPPMPIGLRARCPGCGHFFKLDDLKAHTQWACPGNRDNDGSFGIMCDDKCGCRTLHEAMVCKPGFPRKPSVTSSAAPVEEEQKEEKHEDPDAGDGLGDDPGADVGDQQPSGQAS